MTVTSTSTLELGWKKLSLETLILNVVCENFRHNVRIAVETMNGENFCLTGSLKGSRTGYSDWVGTKRFAAFCLHFIFLILVCVVHQVRGGTNIFQGLITEVCRLPVHQETKLRFTARVDVLKFPFVKV